MFSCILLFFFINNYFLVSGNCYQCNYNCKTKENDNCKCSSCEDGYYLLNYQCLKCSSNCKTCSGSSTYCLSCNEGYDMVSSNNCVSCPQPCKTCSAAYYCSSL